MSDRKVPSLDIYNYIKKHLYQGSDKIFKQNVSDKLLSTVLNQVSINNIQEQLTIGFVMRKLIQLGILPMADQSYTNNPDYCCRQTHKTYKMAENYFRVFKPSGQSNKNFLTLLQDLWEQRKNLKHINLSLINTVILVPAMTFKKHVIVEMI